MREIQQLPLGESSEKTMIGAHIILAVFTIAIVIPFRARAQDDPVNFSGLGEWMRREVCRPIRTRLLVRLR